MKIPAMNRAAPIVVAMPNMAGFEEGQLGSSCSHEAVQMFTKMLENPNISTKAREYAEEMLNLHRVRLGAKMI